MKGHAGDVRVFRPKTTEGVLSGEECAGAQRPSRRLQNMTKCGCYPSSDDAIAGRSRGVATSMVFAAPAPSGGRNSVPKLIVITSGRSAGTTGTAAMRRPGLLVWPRDARSHDLAELPTRRCYCWKHCTIVE